MILTTNPLISIAHVEDYLYSPPFQAGKQFLIVQTFNGTQTHQTEIARYAVDIAMPIGTAVCATRAGFVKKIHNSNDIRISNFVYIQHEDGTISDYEHLLANSIQVSENQSLQKGECFARSGNSGYSSGPHLHFAILQTYGFIRQKYRSIPFKFVINDKNTEPKLLAWIKN